MAKGGGGAQALLQIIQLGGQAVEKIRDNMPLLDDEVTVEVVGQPGSNKQQLYFLALAAANGMVNRMGTNLVSISGSYGMVMIEYDGANDWVRATIRYRWGMAQLAVIEGGSGTSGTDFRAAPPRFKFDNLVVYRGPSCNVVGGPFDFTSTVLPGIPNSSKPTDVPQLPFANQMILTACPTTPEPNPSAITQDPVSSPPVVNRGREILSPNPKPPGDNRSRGAVVISQDQKTAITTGSSLGVDSPVNRPTVDPKICCDKILALVPMVYAALSAPATNAQMTFDSPVAGPNGG